MPRTPLPPADHDADIERRQKLACEIVADGLLTLLIRERLRELDARDAERAVAEEAAARELEAKSVRKAGRRTRAVPATTPTAIAGAPFGRAGAVR